jgi:hypothetical protein
LQLQHGGDGNGPSLLKRQNALADEGTAGDKAPLLSAANDDLDGDDEMLQYQMELLGGTFPTRTPPEFFDEVNFVYNILDSLNS